MSQSVFARGKPLEEAKAAMILVHGRGASAHDILSLADDLHHDGFIYLAPQAEGYQWYPLSFLAPIEQNEPGISSGIAHLKGIVEHLQEAGIPTEKIMLGGFSQGACLALEFVARNAQRYGGVFGFSGGLIGPEGTPRDYEGSLEGTPVFLGCSDIDPHIPKARVLETETVMQKLGGEVTVRLYPGMGHTINLEEIEFVRDLMKEL